MTTHPPAANGPRPDRPVTGGQGEAQGAQDAQAAPSVPDAQQGAPEANTGPSEAESEAEGSPNAEAARYRRRLRAVEAERDALAGRLGTMQRAEVERLAGEAGMAVPADLWTLGTDLAGLLDHAGDVDPDVVAGLVAEVLAARPTWRRPWPDLGQGPRGVPAAPATWSSVLGQRR